MSTTQVARASARLESEEVPLDAVHVASVRGREAISRPFSFEVELVAPGPVSGLTGARASLVFEVSGTEVRRIHGMIAAVVDRLEPAGDHHAYVVTLVPRAARLSLVEMQEIFMDLSIPEIVEKKLGMVGVEKDDVELRLVGSYAPREFVVQYRETDLAFVSRTAEHLGISFFFEHASGHDVVVFTDHNAGFPAAPAHLAYGGRGERRDVFALERRSQLVPSYYGVQDYNYRTPQLDLTAGFELATGDAGGYVEYGTHHKTRAEGEALARVRAEERQAGQHVYHGQSALLGLEAGVRVHIDGHPALDDEELLIVEVEHTMTLPAGMHAASEASYENAFRAVSTASTYRPPRVTPRPRIAGLVTGVIEERLESGVDHVTKIDPDGRYLVKLLFDASAGQGRPSRPVRMLQAHAGPNYGVHFPLKAGVEVLLAFVDGDPDRPVIVGAAPNPMTPSPVVAATSTKNRIKTVSGIVIEMDDAGHRGS